MAWKPPDLETPDGQWKPPEVSKVEAQADSSPVSKTPLRPETPVAVDATLGEWGPTETEPSGLLELLKGIGSVAKETITRPGQALMGAVEPYLPSTSMAKKARELGAEVPPSIKATEAQTPEESQARAGGDFVSKMLQSAALQAAVPGAGVIPTVERSLASTVPWMGQYAQTGDLPGAASEALLNLGIDLALPAIGGGYRALRGATPKAGALDDISDLAKVASTTEAPTAFWPERASKYATERGGALPPPIPEGTIDLSKPKQLGGFEQWRRGIGDVMGESDWRAINAPIEPGTIPLPEYAKASDAFKKNVAAMAPDEIFNRRATAVLQGPVDKARRAAGQQIDNIIQTHQGTVIDVSGLRGKLDEVAQKYAGGRLNWQWDEAAGKARPVVTPLRPDMVVNNSVAKVIEDAAEDLTPMIQSQYSTMDVVHHNKQMMRDYARWKELGGGIPYNSRSDAAAKEIAAYLNQQILEQLPENIASQYADANAVWAKAHNAETALAGVLGREIIPGGGLSRHGGQIGKRALQSSAPGDIREAFRAVKELTGEDLMQDALYANLVMRLSGDQKQVQRALQFGGALQVEALRNLSQGIPGIEQAARLIKAQGSPGALQAVTDYYTKTHGLPRTMLQQSTYTPPDFMSTMEDLLSGSDVTPSP